MKRDTYLFRGLPRRISAIVLLVCTLLSACSTQTEEVPVLMENNNLDLPTVTVQYGDIYNIDFTTGGIHPYSERLNFTSSGLFDCFEVESGQQVKQGDVLAKLDNSVKQAQLDALKESLKYYQDTADLELKALNAAYQQIKEEQAQLRVSGAPDYALEVKSIEAWEATMDINHAEQNHELQFGELEEQVRQMEEELTQETQIVAPFDGTVTWLNSTVKQGDYLTADTPIVAISTNDRLYIISEYMTDTYRTYCERIYAKIGGQEYELTMRERNLKADVANNREGYILTSEYDFVDELPSGTDISGNAMIIFLWNYHPNVLYLPNELVYQNTDGYYVNRVIDNKVVQTSVEIGARSPLETEIVSGLKEGDAVYAQQ